MIDIFTYILHHPGMDPCSVGKDESVFEISQFVYRLIKNLNLYR